MSVSVIGQDYDNVDGLEASLKVHREAHRANGEVLLNLADAAAARARGEKGPGKNDPRPAYVHQPYPKHVYHADGRDRVVQNADELAQAKEDGFRTEPYPKVRVALEDPKAQQAAREAQDRETAGKIASQNDLIQKLAAQVDALTKANKKDKKGE